MAKKIFIAIIIFFVAIQLIPVTKDNPNSNPAHELKAPNEVMSVLKKACYDCHSNQTNYSIYSYIAPLSWGVRMHVVDGRKALNFSEWEKMEPKIRKMRLERWSHVIKMGFMPPKSYILFHPNKKLTKDEEKLLIEWGESELVKGSD